MKKKIVMIALAALVLVIGVIAVTAVTADKEAETMEQTQVTTGPVSGAEEVFDLSGEVIELGDGFFVMQSGEMGPVQVNFGDDTLFEGVAMQEIALGQFVQILYDGKMTRSLPAQVYALKVGMYPIGGEVTAVEEGSITLVRDEIGDEVIVFLPEGAPQIAVGDHVIAYTNGAMTMSLPAQTTALGIVVE